jgi:ferredoxin-NADP reductase
MVINRKLLITSCSRIVIPIFLSGVMLIAVPFFTMAQTAAEHASHHPQQTSAAKPDSGVGMTPNAPSAPSGMGGGMGGAMGGGMGEMMKEMGKPPAKELYPSMMQLPTMSTEKRIEIIRLADERINQGEMLMTTGQEKLKNADDKRDYSKIQEANEQIRRGKKLFESGLIAKRSIAEDKDPRVTALQWFKTEMNLPLPKVDQPHGLIGLSWFHYLTMLTFVVFAALMIWMYFHKMKRANALVEKLTGKTGDKIPPPEGTKPNAPAAPAKGEPAKGAPPIVNPDIAPSKPNSWTGTLLVSEIFDETPSVKTFRLLDPEGGKLPFNYLPGQFITVTINPKGVPVKRSYTISSSPTRRDYCEITVKHEEKGTVSHYMHTEVHIGELMQFTAPSGKFTFTESHAESAIFIAGGVGVTPMMSAIRYLTDRSWKGEIYFFFLCKDEGSIIFHEEILFLQKRYPNFHVFFVLSQMKGEPKDGFISGHITKEILAKHVPDIITRMTHICGPPPMMDAVKKMLEELKVPKELVMVEVFAGPPPAAKAAPTPPAEGGKAPDPNAPLKPEENGKPADPNMVPVEGADAGKTGIVTFAKSNKTAVLTADKSILEASEEVGVNIDYSCRVGTCGVCKTKLNSGKVTMAVEDALTEEDKSQNMILACQAKATEDVSVEA